MGDATSWAAAGALTARHWNTRMVYPRRYAWRLSCIICRSQPNFSVILPALGQSVQLCQPPFCAAGMTLKPYKAGFSLPLRAFQTVRDCHAPSRCAVFAQSLRSPFQASVRARQSPRGRKVHSKQWIVIHTECLLGAQTWQGLLDIQALSRSINPQLRVGLRSMVQHYLGFSPPKSSIITMGDWEAQWLSDAQINYAALDALYVGEIFREMRGIHSNSQ